MTFQSGNYLAVSRRTVENELRKVVHRDLRQDRPKLSRALERCLQDAAEHDSPVHRLACLSFITDRLDGRAIARVETSSGDAPRDLELADLVRLVMAARASAADDAQVVASQEAIPHSRDPAPE